MSSDSGSDPRLKEARALIQAKKYDQARKLLQTIDDPVAERWLAKLNSQSGGKQQKAARSNTPVWIVLGLVIGLAIGGGIGYFVGRESVVASIRAAFSGIGGTTSPESQGTLDMLNATGTAIYANSEARRLAITLTAGAPTVVLEGEELAMRALQDAFLVPISVTVSAAQIDAQFELRQSVMTIEDNPFEISALVDMAKAVCALDAAGFSQTYVFEGVSSESDAFGNDEIVTQVTMRIEPSTRNRLDCSNPLDIDLDVVADEWIVVES